jgi:hypothetical protein
MSGIEMSQAPTRCRQTAAESSLRRIFVLPPNGVLHTALALRQPN